jgi:cell division protein FtsQ
MSSTISSPARSWRDIPQTIAPRAMSSTGRKRMIFANTKAIAALLIGCVSLWGGYEIFQTWETNPAKIKAPVKSAPVKNISLRGQNLVLDQPWVVRTLALPKNADLMELDLYALRERLLASGQVRAAELTRKFPDTLLVSIEERSPVARINARFGDGNPEEFLVARDGVVYRGACYKEDVTKSLPYLAGVALKRSNGKLQPIEGMETVADLLNTARTNVPGLYHNWSIIDLQKLGSDGQITVQSGDAGAVTFGTREDFYKQIARLDYIIDQSKLVPTPVPLKSINLAVGEQVPVSFQVPAAQADDAKTNGRSGSNPGHSSHANPRNLRAAPTRPLQANSAPFHRFNRDI